MNRPARSRLAPYALLLFAGTIWGSTFSLARIATAAGAHPIGLNFWQVLICTGIMLLVCVCRGKWPALNRAAIWRYVAVAAAGSVIPGTLYFYAAAHLPAGILALTVAVVPMFTYLASLLIGSDHFSGSRVWGLLLGIGGMALVAHPDALPEPSMLPWVLAGVLCAVCYTLENLFVDNKVAAETDMICFITGAFVAASCLLLPVALLTDSLFMITTPFDRVEYSIFSIALITAVSYLIFLTVIQSSGAVFASMLAYTVTLSGVAWGMLIFSERHSGVIWLALALLLAGMVLVKPLNKQAISIDPDGG